MAGRRPESDRRTIEARAGAEPSSILAVVRLLTQTAVAFIAFAVAVGIAELAGAINLGTAFGVGQIAFAVAAVALLLRA